jgi:hypothetical protein
MSGKDWETQCDLCDSNGNNCWNCSMARPAIPRRRLMVPPSESRGWSQKIPRYLLVWMARHDVQYEAVV